MKLRMLPEALDELVEAGQWYERKQSGLGQRFLERFGDTWKWIARSPLQFPKIEIDSDRIFQRAALNDFPYDVIFEARSPVLLIVAVSHHKRSRDHWHGRVT
jgi:hypothetical protein